MARIRTRYWSFFGQTAILFALTNMWFALPVVLDSGLRQRRHRSWKRNPTPRERQSRSGAQKRPSIWLQPAIQAARAPEPLITMQHFELIRRTMLRLLEQAGRCPRAVA